MRVDEIAARSVDPEAELIRRMAAGDREAHRLLYERNALHVLRFLIGQLGGDRPLAEEVLQEVMLAAWQGAAGFRGASRPRTWLFGIAHHQAANILRKRGRECATSEKELEVAQDARGGGKRRDRGLGEIDRGLDLQRALRILPSEQRDALELVFYYGLSVVETAEVLGVAPGTIKSRLFRAKARLREHMGPDQADPDHPGHEGPGYEPLEPEEGANDAADA